MASFATTEIMEQKVAQIMTDFLDIDCAAIHISTAQSNTPNWDSISHVNLIVAVEQEFEMSFTPDEIESMVSFADILRILHKKCSKETF